MHGNVAIYFAKNRPQPKFFIGDRVFGKYNKIPFVGTVGISGMVSEEEGIRAIVFLDLPLKFKNKYLTYIKVKEREIKLLPELKDRVKPTRKKTAKNIKPKQ
jgi:hypothetical protein